MFRGIISGLFVASALAAVSSNTVTRTLKDAPVESGLCDATVDSYSGYFNVKSGVDKNYFYWFFESRSETQSTDPVIVWLTGGPGCSSQLALLTENGPCTVSEDGQSTVNNPFSWNTNANIMWLDQPASVGFSYGAPIVDNDHNEAEVGEDVYWFMQEFYKAHPEFRANDLYIFGESYGGHYAPSVASRIFEGNNNKDGEKINLAGVGVGNGLTDPVIQYQYYPAMAMNNTYGIKTVSEEAYEKMVKHVPTCTKMGQMCQLNTTYCEAADEFCQMTETMPYYNTGLNPYDIRKPCGDSDLCYDFTNIETFLNLPSTMDALHVNTEKVKEWKSCNTVVNAGFTSDWMKNYQQVLIPMLEADIDVLIYAGDVDFVCNWMGNKAWTMDLPWSGKNDFVSAEDITWSYVESGDDVAGGLVRTADAAEGSGSLTFLQVYEAGHMVPMDKPQAALTMLNTFIQKKSFVDTK